MRVISLAVLSALLFSATSVVGNTVEAKFSHIISG